MRSLKAVLAGVAVMMTAAGMAGTASGAIESRSILKTYFETGDVPTQDQFANFIDSFVHFSDDGVTSYHISGVGAEALSSIAIRVLAEDQINNTTYSFAAVSPGGPVPVMAPNFGGRSGFLALRLSNSAGDYYGYFQLSMDDGSVSPAGIHVDYFAMETSGQGITATAVPEAGTLGMLGIVGAGLLRRKGRRLGY